MKETGATQPARISASKVGLGIAGLLLFGLLLWGYDVFWGANHLDTETKTFFVSRGQSFSTIVDSLESQKIIRSRPLFIFVAKLFGGTDRMRVGKYEFPDGISNLDIFLSIREGERTVLIPVTLRPGRWARRYAGTLAHSVGIDSSRYMELVHDERFSRSLGVGRSSLEGYLLPETYSFHWQQSEESIIREQIRQFWLVYNDSLRAKAGRMGWSTKDVVTMASIIEGEIVLPEEARRVSGVYHNRLKRGMRLQADPTIQYFVENGPRRLTYEDLKEDHPYNTYRFSGLPPGPVNNPSALAIVAALDPEAHSYLYFVANGKGGHWFSKSYAEHLRFVRKYRRDRARREAEAQRQTSGQPAAGGL